MNSSPTRAALPMVLVVMLAATSIAASAADLDVDEVDDVDDVQRLARQIDEIMQEHWDAAGITPVSRASDAEFLRRVWLDIAGKIPPAADVHDFLVETSPDKRERVVNELLAGPNYIMNFSDIWRSVMLPESETNLQVRFMLPGFNSWLRSRLAADARYNNLVREILTARVQGMNPYDMQNPNPIAFYQAKEIKPENLAAATSRMFLGVRIECAQCHDHPFDDWKQRDFWGYAAFFAAMERAPNGNGFLGQLRELFSRRSLSIPETNETVEATYLDGQTPNTPSGISLRVALASWITSKENPYFSRTVVNRLWGHFFGMGIVDPVDDFSDHNPPSLPELLDLLAKELADHDFDLKFIMRAITSTRAYQLSSHQSSDADPNVDRSLFARMPIKGMTAEQLYNSLAQATGFPNPFEPGRNGLGGSPRQLFIESFSDSQSAPTERQKSVLQALTIMNGDIVGNATRLDQSFTLAAIADYPLFDTKQKIESLFLSTLSRKPREEELERLVQYVEFENSEDDRQQALSDVFWALLNSNEFSVNR